MKAREARQAEKDGWALAFAVAALKKGQIRVSVSRELIDAAKEVLHQLTRNRTHDVQGDWTLADGYGLDDEVAALSEAITAAEGSAD